jgi:hypothetical protein
VLRITALSATAAVVLQLFLASGTLAQGPSSSDPSHGSPAEAIYDIPLGPARLDAAPARPDARPADPGVGTAYRSENGFGSSTIVPGATPAAARAARVASVQATHAVIRNRPPRPSEPGFFILAGLVLVVGAYSGLLAARALRRVD